VKKRRWQPYYKSYRPTNFLAMLVYIQEFSGSAPNNCSFAVDNIVPKLDETISFPMNGKKPQ